MPATIEATTDEVQVDIVPDLHACDMPVLTSRDIEKFTGIPHNSLHRWINNGVLRPVNARGGIGRHLKFTISDLVAVHCGLYFRKQGFDSGWVAGAVRLIADLGSKLKDELDSGRTWLAVGTWCGKTYLPGRMIEPPAPDDLTSAQAELLTRLDISQIIRQMSAKVSKVIKKGKKG